MAKARKEDMVPMDKFDLSRGQEQRFDDSDVITPLKTDSKMKYGAVQGHQNIG